MEASIAAQGGTDEVLLPALLATANDNEFIYVRRMVFVLHEFCRPVLARCLSPAHFWWEVCQPVLAAGKQVACQQLSDCGHAILTTSLVCTPGISICKYRENLPRYPAGIPVLQAVLLRM